MPDANNRSPVSAVTLDGVLSSGAGSLSATTVIGGNTSVGSCDAAGCAGAGVWARAPAPSALTTSATHEEPMKRERTCDEGIAVWDDEQRWVVSASNVVGSQRG